MLGLTPDGIFGISIHALREESDVVADFGGDSFVLFQSTPSARRATFSTYSSPRKWAISIHALREESDRS